MYHLIEEDKELQEIYTSCKNGKKMCGQCKKYATQLMDKLLSDIQEKRKVAVGNIKKYLTIWIIKPIVSSHFFKFFI